MANESGWEAMLDMFIFETQQLIEELERSMLKIEKSSDLQFSINEIFRVMHTVKSSAAMMLFENIAALAHTIEDLFYYLREKKPQHLDYASLTDIVLAGIDFIKAEIDLIASGGKAEGDASEIIKSCQQYLTALQEQQSDLLDSEPVDLAKPSTPPGDFQDTVYHKENENQYQVCIYFQDHCEMENVRAFLVLRNLKELCTINEYFPADIIENDAAADQIRKNGFRIIFTTVLDIEEIKAQLLKTAFLKELQVSSLKSVSDSFLDQAEDQSDHPEIDQYANKKGKPSNLITSRNPTLINVNVRKLDMLMDLVGELVISNSMVTQNPDLLELNLESLRKATRQLNKITYELQDVVMSIRMVSLSMTFQKMHRVVRDMSHKLGKAVQLKLIGEETEVDKNIIEQISDPILHLIRNAIDHGIESSEERKMTQKEEIGTITLEARNAGGDVWIIIKDDGKGLDREKILQRALEHGLLDHGQAVSDQEIYSFILLPGFSTKEQVTEFSGRGVGMDVVVKNIQKLGGTVLVNSTPGFGTAVSLKIPLTLAIIEGMIIKVGGLHFTVPMTVIKESFKIGEQNIIVDPEGHEMALIRGECYSIIRLHEFCRLPTEVTRIQDGIIIMVEYEAKTICLFADALLGEQQVVIKSLPQYIQKRRGQTRGLGGCTLLGDGTISLILDVAGLVR